jgi:hypothetical protein
MATLAFFALFLAVVAAAVLHTWAADGQVNGHGPRQAWPALPATEAQSMAAGRSALRNGALGNSPLGESTGHGLHAADAATDDAAVLDRELAVR